MFATAVFVAGTATAQADGSGVTPDGAGTGAGSVSVLATAAVDQRGTVRRVVDGDTLEVDVAGDGTSTPVPVRNVGLQAMENGDCHYAEAKAALAAAAPVGSSVRLTAAHAGSRSRGRLLRLVDVLHGTTTSDPQLAVIRAGQALPLVFPEEPSRWRAYETAGQTAKRAGTNLWDPDYCRSGPQQGVPIRLWVNWDAEGTDTRNINGEYVRVLNAGTVPLSVGGWVIRTAAQDGFRIPAGTSIPAHATLTLRVGRGTPSGRTFYWGRTAVLFPNWYQAGTHGSGAYLFDPDGDLRASALYPCLVSCTDGRKGKLTMAVHYDAPGDDTRANPNGEYVTVTASSAVNLSHTVMTFNGNTLELGGGSTLVPGQKLVVRMGRGTATARTKYWGRSSVVLNNGGGSVELRTTEGIRLVCKAWGSGRC